MLRAGDRLTWTAYAALVLVGLYVTALGPGLPGLAERSHIPVAQAGTLLTALFLGGLVTSLGAGRALDGLGARPLLMAGSLANGAGCFVLPLATSWAVALGAGVLMGVGDAIMVVGYHVVLARLNPESAGAALNRLNVFFGLGALAGPALAGLSLVATGDVRYALWPAAAGQALVAVSLAWTDIPTRGSEEETARVGLRRLLLDRMLWLLAALIAVYVGLEIGVGGWTFTYLRGAGGFGVTASSLLVSGYWLALTLGRVFSSFALARTTDVRYLAAATGGAACAGALLLVLADWRPGGAACILAAGFCFGPIWPGVFALAARLFAGDAGAASGLLAAAGSVGGLVLPWLLGVALLGNGVYAGMGIALAGCTAMLVLALVALRLVPAVGDVVAGNPH